MAKITFVTEDGENVVIDDATGTLMEIATSVGVEGIDGACGGVCSCATCHVRVRPEWFERVGKADEIEQDMLDIEDKADPFSRLCCQVEMTEALDGLVVDVVKL